MATRGSCCRFWIMQRRALRPVEAPCGSGELPESLDASPAPPHPLAVLSLGLGLYAWTALPLQASAGSKLHSAARGLTLRPTNDCGRYGCR